VLEGVVDECRFFGFDLQPFQNRVIGRVLGFHQLIISGLHITAFLREKSATKNLSIKELYRQETARILKMQEMLSSVALFTAAN
jgi:hypothetical protein